MPSQSESQVVITYTRSGGLAGISETWTIYADGQVTSAEGNTWQRTPTEVADLAQLLDELGVFALAPAYLPKDPCCDRFTHELTVTSGAKEVSVTTLDSTPGAPEELWEALRLVQTFVAGEK